MHRQANTIVATTGRLLIDAYREEAALFRADGKEAAAQRLERQADRMEALSCVPKNKESK